MLKIWMTYLFLANRKIHLSITTSHRRNWYWREIKLRPLGTSPYVTFLRAFNNHPCQSHFQLRTRERFRRSPSVDVCRRSERSTSSGCHRAYELCARALKKASRHFRRSLSFACFETSRPKAVTTINRGMPKLPRVRHVKEERTL